MKLLLLFGAFECAFMVLLLAGKTRKQRSDWFLGLFFLLFSLSIGGAYAELLNWEQGYPYPHLININWLLLFLHGPALWLYVRTLTDAHFRSSVRHLLHTLPFLFFCCLHWLVFLSLPAEEKVSLAVTEQFRQDWPFLVSVRSIAVSVVGYHLWCLWLIRRFRQRLVQEYASTKNLDLQWLRVLLFTSLAVYAINVLVVNANGVLYHMPHQHAINFTYAFASLYALALSYYGLRQGQVFISPGIEISPSPMPVQAPATQTPSASPVLAATANPASSPDPEAQTIARLTEMMEREKPFLEPEITLSVLSARLHVRPEYLSNLLNHRLGQTFSDFINQRRIMAFKQMRQDPAFQHYSVVGLAFMCGFNSKASFYRALKKFE